jgi:predicted RNase H-like HicB family nuclease
MMKSENKDIQINYDTVSNSYYIVWQPMVVISAGPTIKEALNDLKEAAHFGIDIIIDEKLKAIS